MNIGQMESVDWKPDEGGLRILIVAGPDIEGEMLFCATREARVHSCQPGRPVVCPCGVVHLACDPSDITVLVGCPDHTIHTHPDTVGVQVVPFGSDVAAARYPAIVAHEPRDFGPWAATVVRTIACGITVPGLIGFDFTDVLRGFRILKCLGATGGEGIEQAARRLTENPFFDPGARACVVGLFIGVNSSTLADVTLACERVQQHLSDDASIMFFCVGHDDPRVLDEISILFGIDPTMPIAHAVQPAS